MGHAEERWRLLSPQTTKEGGGGEYGDVAAMHQPQSSTIRTAHYPSSLSAAADWNRGPRSVATATCTDAEFVVVGGSGSAALGMVVRA